MHLLKKHLVLLSLLCSTFCIVLAAMAYPGGTLLQKNTQGFLWTENFISNLFAVKALNGEENPLRYLAVLGVAFHSLAYGLFFIHMSRKMISPHASSVLYFVGFANILFNVLVATSLHDAMIVISSSVSLLGLFYITVYILKTRLLLFKIACILSLLTFYYTLFLYGAGNWPLLAIMQKVSFICSMLLVLSLEYFTSRHDFEERPTDETKSGEAP